MHFGHKSRAITLLFLNEIIPLANPYHSCPIQMPTLLFLNEIIPLANPYHSCPIQMPMQSLKKIGKKVLKLEQETLDPIYTGLVNTVQVLYLLVICCLG